jgi:Cu-processing system ATP-binding protein
VTNSMIEVNKLNKSFGKLQILRDLSFSVRRGMITGIAGPNACGKTTAIKCLLGLVIPESGKISVDGRDSTYRADQGFDARRAIGYMPQDPDFPQNLKIIEILDMVEKLRGQAAVRKVELSKYFEIGPVLKRTFGQLSGGTKQKVAAVVAFMFDPPLLILDEPTAGLDPVSTVRFKELLTEEQKNGKTLLVVSHFMGELEQVASDLVYVADGQVIFNGSIEEIRDRYRETTLERAITHLLVEARK